MSDTQDDFPNCAELYNKFSYCLLPSTQYKYIYKEGIAMNCGTFFDDWRTCLYSKLITDEEKRKALYKETNHYAKSKALRNDVFNYKDKPSWEIDH